MRGSPWLARLLAVAVFFTCGQAAQGGLFYQPGPSAYLTVRHAAGFDDLEFQDWISPLPFTASPPKYASRLTDGTNVSEAFYGGSAVNVGLGVPIGTYLTQEINDDSDTTVAQLDLFINAVWLDDGFTTGVGAPRLRLTLKGTVGPGGFAQFFGLFNARAIGPGGSGASSGIEVEYFVENPGETPLPFTVHFLKTGDDLGYRPQYDFGLFKAASLYFRAANDGGPTDIGITNFSFEMTGPAAAVPEPSSLTLLVLGSVGLIGYGWRRRRGPPQA